MLETPHYWKKRAEELYLENSELRAEVHELKEDSDQDALELWIYRILAVVGWACFLGVILLSPTTGA